MIHISQSKTVFISASVDEGFCQKSELFIEHINENNKSLVYKAQRDLDELGYLEFRLTCSHCNIIFYFNKTAESHCVIKLHFRPFVEASKPSSSARKTVFKYINNRYMIIFQLSYTCDIMFSLLFPHLESSFQLYELG